jgi:hypothetical protein
MTAAAATVPARTERRSAHAVYRDDGPLARAAGALLGGLRVPSIALAAAGVLPLLALIAVGGADVPEWAAGAALAWLVLAGGAATGRPERGRLRWLLPGVLRLGEYAGLLWISALAGPSSAPAAFALLAAIAFRHYDLVYRLRHRGVTPAGWVNALAAGWDGRLAIAFALLVAGALPTGFFVWAAVLAVAFVGEAVAGWVVVGRVQRPVEYEDEEDEGQ